ncbi:MAG: S10 family serine carboxypeptidase-like protein, partial [Pseudomonadota bacterium]
SADIERDRGRIFVTSYLLAQSGGAPFRRPVIFLFNGGPGSSSAWLHIGAFGPRRLALPQGPTDFGAPPFDLVDNPHTLLDVADLVFIDPIETGWSTLDVADEDNVERWRGRSQDARSVAATILAWVEKHERWNAPRYILGESYGAVRAATILSEISEDWFDLPFNGAILVSSGIGLGDIWSGRDETSNAVALFPTYAAVARFHGKSKPNRKRRSELQSVEDFAVRELPRAILLGDGLDGAEAAALAGRAEALTGLSAGVWRERDFLIDPATFARSLLADEDKILGRYDARLIAAAESGIVDPSNERIVGAFVDGVNYYLRTELSMKRPDRRYELVNESANFAWEYFSNDPRGSRSFGNNRAASDLAAAAARNGDLRVFIASGLYDLVTPYFGAETALTRAGMPPERLEMRRYEGGHMMYLNEKALAELSRDIRNFIAARADAPPRSKSR